MCVCVFLCVSVSFLFYGQINYLIWFWFSVFDHFMLSKTLLANVVECVCVSDDSDNTSDRDPVAVVCKAWRYSICWKSTQHTCLVNQSYTVKMMTVLVIAICCHNCYTPLIYWLMFCSVLLVLAAIAVTLKQLTNMQMILVGHVPRILFCYPAHL